MTSPDFIVSAFQSIIPNTWSFTKRSTPFHALSATPHKRRCGLFRKALETLDGRPNQNFQGGAYFSFTYNFLFLPA